MQVDLKGKVAVVTGAGGGIGNVIALKMAENGADIVVGDVNESAGQLTVKMVENLDRKAIFCKADVSNMDDMNAMTEEALDKFGRIDILVNNAGVNTNADGRKLIHEFNDKDWEWVLNVDLNGVYRCSKPIVRHMVQNGYGKIINMGSIVGLVPLRLQCAFAAAKAAVFNLTKAMAIELAEHGICVNAIAPGSIDVEINKNYFNKETAKSDSLLSHIPMHRRGQPVEIANSALFLASDDASYITGAVLVVDGGWTCGFSRDW